MSNVSNMSRLSNFMQLSPPRGPTVFDPVNSFTVHHSEPTNIPMLPHGTNGATGPTGTTGTLLENFQGPSGPSPLSHLPVVSSMNSLISSMNLPPSHPSSAQTFQNPLMSSSSSSGLCEQDALAKFTTNNVLLQRCVNRFREESGSWYAQSNQNRDLCKKWLLSEIQKTPNRCWMVRWGQTGEESFDYPLYLRWCHSVSTSDLSAEGIDKAIDQLDEKHLAESFAKLKKAKKSYQIIDVWLDALEKQIKQQHASESDGMKLDYSAERGSKNKVFPEVPPDILQACRLWHKAKQEISKCSAKKEMTESKLKEEIKSVESAVKEHVLALNPATKETNVPVREGTLMKEVKISVNEQHTSKPVKLRAFKPRITEVLQAVVPVNYVLGQPITPDIKQQLKQLLVQQFYNAETSGRKTVQVVQFENY